MTHAERGRLGGNRTFQVHGAIHMEAIGRAGLHTTVQRYYGGDVGAYMRDLRARQGQQAEHDPHLGCRVSRA